MAGREVCWQYQTILFEFQKDGLLGDKYIDDEDVQNILNEHGQFGWELVNVSPVEEGLLAFLKKKIQPATRKVGVRPPDAPAAGSSEDRKIRKAAEQVLVQDQELVRRPEKRKKKNIAKGDDDLIGGIKIS